MSAGFLFLSVLALLVFCGLLQRVLDRLHMTDRQALFLIGVMIVGTFLPNISIGLVSIGIGGAVIPLGICIWLFIKADSSAERWRAGIGSLLSGAAVYMLSSLLPPEAEAMLLDPMWLYGLFGGLIAWVFGRSRRAAFICGVIGIVLADIASAAMLWVQGFETQLVLGGAGIADASVISGAIGVLFCELLGEVVERFARVWADRSTRQK